MMADQESQDLGPEGDSQEQNSSESEPVAARAQTPPSVSESSSDSEDEDYLLLKKLAAVTFEDRVQDLYLGTGFTCSDLFAQHRCEWAPEHPESPQRILEPLSRCKALGLVERCKHIDVSYAGIDTLLTKHSRELVEIAEATATMTYEERKQLAEKYDSWFCNKVTYEASLASCGSVINMAKNIVQGTVTNGFAMVRPPGHHAQEKEFNGYCTFNNVAVAAQVLLDGGLDKIVILDWDVHHGQGIQQMFYHDPRVLYISIHGYEHGLYWPNLRESDYDYIGQDKGKGFNVNIPLNQIGIEDTDYLALFHHIILPLVYEFSPQLILLSSGYDAVVGCPEYSPQLVLVSSGFDAAIGDEKGAMLLTPAMYAHMTHHMMAFATGRVCVALEGGYCIKSLAEGCALTLRTLLQDPVPTLLETGEPSDSIINTILNVVKVLRPHWNCFAHYKSTGRSQLCPFEDVNYMPPKEGIEFSTPKNRPDKFELIDFPRQEVKERERLSNIIQNLIDRTDLSVATTRCSYVFDANMRAHEQGGHPESPDRISAIYTRLSEWRLLKRMLRVPSRLAKKAEILRIHSEDYIEDLVSSETLEEEELRSFPMRKSYMSIYMNQKSLYCALLSCGSVLNLVEAILTKQTQSGVAIVRPPGHHAECTKAMGFCFFNNVAVAAKFAQHHFGLKRILILDWDIHHGNATQHQFYNDPSILYISLHRFDGGFFFPGTQDGNIDMCGEGAGLGFNVNIAWTGGRMGDAEYITAFNQIVMPIAYQFTPEFVFISAGFDAAVGDPLGNYRVTPAGYGHMTHMLMGLANGRIALLLEGGYNLMSISESFAVCTSVLLGEPCPMLDSLVPQPSAVTTIGEVMEIQKQYWSCLKCKVAIPSVRQVESQRWEREKSALEEKRAKSRGGPRSAKTTQAKIVNASANEGGSSSVTNDLGDIKAVSNTSHVTPSVTNSHDDQVISRLETGLAGMNVSPGTSSYKGDNRTPQKRVAQTTTNLNNSGSSVLNQGGARPKTKQPTQWGTQVKSTFVSTLGTQDPDSEPLSIHGQGGFKRIAPKTESEDKEKNGFAGENRTQMEPHGSGRDGCGDRDVRSCSGGSSGAGGGGTSSSGGGNADQATGSGSSEGAGAEEGAVAGGSGGASGGAGGGRRPNTVEEILQMQGGQQMFAVTPLSWCPHLPEVRPVPATGLDSQAPCNTCGDLSENWVCLTCYQVECSRFVNEHMLYHRLETEHNLVLSFSDISVWCYCCDHYVDNPVLFEAKNAAHISKFGEPLPGMT